MGGVDREEVDGDGISTGRGGEAGPTSEELVTAILVAGLGFTSLNIKGRLGSMEPRIFTALLLFSRILLVRSVTDLVIKRTLLVRPRRLPMEGLR